MRRRGGEEEGDETEEAQTWRESKRSGEEKTIPFVTDEAFIQKRGFSKFPVDILCSLFSPYHPSTSCGPTFHLPPPCASAPPWQIVWNQ